ncbi:PQQ-dependent sugar dehydrogenase [Altererythrobacter salegens]|uniref:PQQ-dependent sugar dehydrogenase n=1 Tax=Croceibacterium salegens TaxID=1737568 RepID=A0A6I4STN7_9SPHN|nr:PQQ-dependent sugar dehydrogenase [Croceibacterium salegens]MXO59223.1 PQQ-dependent sugar dehydrogenase [Croceibacterium salegens]
MRRLLGIVALLSLTSAASGQQPPDIGIAPVELTAPSYTFDTAEQHRIKVTPLVRGLGRPFALELLPNGDLLVTERGSDLLLLKGATTPGAAIEKVVVAGMPKPVDAPATLGLQDVALAPDFATSHLIYFTYNEPAPIPEGAPPRQRPARFTIMRGKLEDGKLTGVATVLQGGVAGASGSRLAFGGDGKLYATTGGPFGDTSQDLSNIYGKVLRINPDGTIPADNPFVGEDGKHPALWSYGHRDQHGLLYDPATGAILNAEHGPNGGDEVNLIKRGANYGWPDYSFGREYDGKQIGAHPTSEGIENPLLVWIPSIAPSGLMIYRGDRFPSWKGNLFVGSARRGEVPFTGGLERVVVGEDYHEVRRETLLTELHQRVRDFVQSADGLIYVLTDGNENAVLRIEPSE